MENAVGFRVYKIYRKLTAMCSQDRKVRSLAKKVLGSIRMGVVLAKARGSPFFGARELNHQSRGPALFFSGLFRPKPGSRPSYILHTKPHAIHHKDHV